MVVDQATAIEWDRLLQKFPKGQPRRPGDVITDGVAQYLCTDNPNLCVCMDPPGHLFRVPPDGCFDNLGRVENHLDKWPVQFRVLYERLEFLLEPLLKGEGIDNEWQRLTVKKAILRNLTRLYENL